MERPIPAGEAAVLLEPLSLVGDAGSLGAAWGKPLLVVEASGDGAPANVAPPANLPLVVVAVATAVRPTLAPGGADLYLCPAEPGGVPAPWVAAPEGIGAAVEHLTSTVAAHPYAASVLTQLLRLRPSLDRAQAAVAESLAFGLLQASDDHRGWLASRPHRRRASERLPTRLERQGNELWVTLTRPGRRNAFDAAMRDALAEACAVAALDPTVTSLRIRGEGPSFCSGGDLDEFGTATNPAAAHGVRTTRQVGLLLAALSARTVLEVHGPCFGAGVELAAFGRHVVAAPGTTFTLPELSMGLIPGAGGTVSLPARIGASRTAWMALSGEALDVDTALAWGLVDEIVTPTDWG